MTHDFGTSLAYSHDQADEGTCDRGPVDTPDLGRDVLDHVTHEQGGTETRERQQ